MSHMKGLLRWFSTLFRRHRFEEELTEEIELHLEMAAAEHIRRGMTPEMARREACREFGGVERFREQVRESGRILQLENVIRDTRHALRSLARTPLFTVSLILTLGIGIGCAMAMLGLVHTVLIRPLPFPDSKELVLCQTTWNGHPNPWSSGPDFFDYRAQCEGFESLSAIMPFPQMHTVTGGEEPERISGTAVSPELFTTLGVAPLRGRVFSAEESAADAPEAVIISHRFWRRFYSEDVGAVGRVLTVDGVGRTIVGIMPAAFEFSFMGEFDFWRPMRPDRDVSNRRDRHNWLLIGRLAEGHSLEQVQAQADAVSARLIEEYPESSQIGGYQKGMLLVDLQAYFAGGYRTGLLILLATAGLLLLIAGANITCLLLARDHSRREELAVRRSLGASRGRLLSQLLIERIVAATAAGLLGAVLILWLQPLILRFYPIEVPGSETFDLSPMVVSASLILAVVVVIFAGLVPALRCTAGGTVADLANDGRRILAGPSKFRRGLIFAQIALTVTLLVGSGLLIRSLIRLMQVEPGFNPESVLTAEVELPASRYSGRAARLEFYSSLLERMDSAPGTESAALINYLPIRDRSNWFWVHPDGNQEAAREILLRSVTPDYFRTMQIPILRGRPIGNEDMRGNPRCVLSRALAYRLFPDGDPIGRQVTLDYFEEERNMQVVGIADDVRAEGLEADPGEILYAAYPVVPYPRMMIVIRTVGETSASALALRSAVGDLDDDIPVARLATMEDLIAESVSGRRTMTVVLTLFAVIPLFLAAVGLYGLLAYDVRRRFREIGVRVALGAAPGTVVSLILRQGLGLVGLGVVVGGVSALGATRLIRNQLFGLGPADPVTFLGVGVVVVLVALVACLVPTLQAVHVDPNEALRVE